MQILIETALNNISEVATNVQELSHEVAQQMVDAAWPQDC